jgi:Peptidase family M23
VRPWRRAKSPAVGPSALSTRTLCFALLLLLISAPLFSLDWPVAKRVITGTFGEDRGDHFHNGIDIGVGPQEVHPVLPGELVFRYDENDDYTSFPRGTGTTLVLHHEQNILSVYFHLQNGSLGPVRPSYLATDRLGIVGDSGRSEGPDLHFGVYDEETGSAINPLSFLPPLPDAQPPVIRRVFLSVGDQRLPLQDGAVLKPGKGMVLADASDLREDVKFSWQLAPYSVTLSLDGAQVAKIAFDSLQVVDGRMVVSGTTLDRAGAYGSDGLLRCGAVELRAGESHLRVSVRDFAGNETVKEIRLTIRE